MKRALLILALLLAGCATTDGVKGAGLVRFAPEGITDDAAKPKRHALIVGIDAFDDERFNDLKFAAADAKAMAGALQEFDEVRLLTDPKQTSRAAILEAIAEIGNQATQPRDTVLLYFSTHGSLGRKPAGALERYLVAADTRMNLLSQTGIAVDGLLDVVDALPSQRKVVVLATCHSGKGKSKVDDALSDALAALKTEYATPPLEEVSEATIILTASAFGDTARESSELGHDIYTNFFLEALDVTRGDRDGNGAVTASEAHDYARDHTYEYTRGLQRPTAESAILGRDPVVLAGRAERLGMPVLFSYAPSSEGLQVAINGTVKGGLPGGIAVPAGSYELSLRDAHSGETIYQGAIHVERGEVLEISRLLPEPRHFLLVASGTGMWPLLSTTRGEYWPLTGGAQLAGRIRNWPFDGVVLGAGAEYHGGKGRALGFGEELPFTYNSVGFDVRGGYAVQLSDSVFFTPMLSMGGTFAFREFDTRTFRKSEDMRGFRFGVDLGVEWEIVDGLWLFPGIQAGALVADLGGDLGPHPYVGAMLGVGKGF